MCPIAQLQSDHLARGGRGDQDRQRCEEHPSVVKGVEQIDDQWDQQDRKREAGEQSGPTGGPRHEPRAVTTEGS